ncbi:MAG: DUF2085 domain-containing protein [Lachnospiraceae bacterium]
MSRLRSSFLEQIRILGNQSGCHQLPERSFFYKGKQFPVCARCTGVFIGQTCAVVISLTKIKISTIKSLFLLSIMGFDWFIQEINIKESNNIRRLITGIAGGFGLFNLYINTFRKILQFTKSKTS